MPRMMPMVVLIAVALTGGVASAQHRRGDTIGDGRPVDCLFDAPPRVRCTFYPRNGDGSFVLEHRAGGGRLYYATRVGPNAMRFEVSDGRRSTDIGVFARSRDDRACWVRRDRRICAW